MPQKPSGQKWRIKDTDVTYRRIFGGVIDATSQGRDIWLLYSWMNAGILQRKEAL